MPIGHKFPQLEIQAARRLKKTYVQTTKHFRRESESATRLQDYTGTNERLILSRSHARVAEENLTKLWRGRVKPQAMTAGR